MVTDKPAITVIFYSSSPSLPFHFKPGLVQIVEFAPKLELSPLKFILGSHVKGILKSLFY